MDNSYSLGYLITKIVKEDKIPLLASLIDNTSLVPRWGLDGTYIKLANDDLKLKCADAVKYGMNICTWPWLLDKAKVVLKEMNPDNKVKIYAVNDFPSGEEKGIYKLEEALRSFHLGADGIDTVHNVDLLKRLNLNLPYKELFSSSEYKAYVWELEILFSGVSKYNDFFSEDKEVRVIIKAPYLKKEEIEMASSTIADLAIKYKVKTKIKERTGFEKEEKFLEKRDRFKDIYLMRQSADSFKISNPVGIKPSGGFKTALDYVKALIAAGCINEDLSLKSNLELRFSLGTTHGRELIEDFMRYR